MVKQIPAKYFDGIDYFRLEHFIFCYGQINFVGNAPIIVKIHFTVNYCKNQLNGDPDMQIPSLKSDCKYFLWQSIFTVKSLFFTLFLVVPLILIIQVA